MSDAHEAPGPRPEPLRFFGTTWVDHDGGYALRRAGVAAGSLVAAVAGAFLLRFGYEGLAIAQVGGLVNLMVVVAFAVCSALGFRRTWDGFVRRPEAGATDAAAERSMHSIVMIGFVGVLLAYFFRSFVEAPGERLHRAEYEQESARHERRRSARTGNPAARASKGRRKHP
ncbi:hypothetical protein BLA24_03300 [Streptomyces cinnamoneus]|uniref:EamA/RhaT family transporter n=1 Tax=Streptomyces cinnamoneus TaxID=53446 RepID=A0A2G1XPG7_STRCJ|nr:hypothetical protein [Streptomyces cinnamoneus]PHQ53110.1 hypothetical protein BLA24_03300 [Streptomyces cinnamoneus]PPT14338.1 hypothetical protein CYQ11_16990 [Streptomyces cinnamoneus]